eukprot:TRINITY_DN145_c0_g1_i7.p1 TRINITY_DN145_c0_g1~~TRINITY_DN145_c0_g1_i7.p1  ORF type:complete len:192 (+),score=47.32 TRINITY_DN145_c0_g1_i7:3132-3707(+)
MKRVNSSSSTDSELYVPPEDNRSNTSKAQSKHQNSCWYYLRRYKKKLREVYANDMQMAFNRGFKEGKESSEVRTLVKHQYQQGHAQGMFNAIARVKNPTIPIAPSPYTPSFVVSQLKDLQTEFERMRKERARYYENLSLALKEGTFKAKQVDGNIAIKSIVVPKFGRRKRKRSIEDTISEIDNLKKIQKAT